MADLINTLGGATGFGEGVLPKADDTSLRIPLTDIFQNGIKFGWSTYTSLFLNNNGNVTFGTASDAFNPAPFPYSSNPMIAALWSDVDTTGPAGEPSPGGSSLGTNRVYFDLDPQTLTFTATWDDVGPFSSGTADNAFQLRIIARPADETSRYLTDTFDIEFRYEAVNWLRGSASPTDSAPQWGYDAGDGINYFNGIGSRTAFFASALPTSTTGGGDEAGVISYINVSNAFAYEAPSIAVATAQAIVLEPASGTVALTFELTRTGDLSRTSSVSWTVGGLGAQPAGADDFAAGALPGGIVQFAAGASRATVTIEVAADALPEAAEQFSLTLSDAVGAILGQATATGTILPLGAPPPAGGPGNDVIDASAAAGAVTLQGGDGSDLLAGGAGSDSIVGGNGTDIASHAGNDASQGISVNLAGGTDGRGGTDSFSGIEGVIGGAGADSIDFTGASFAATLAGGAGDDTLVGGTPGAMASYAANGASAAISLTHSRGSDGLGGTDSLIGVNAVLGGAGADTIDFTAGSGAATLLGGDGDDLLRGGLGSDLLSGGGGTDTADFRSSATALSTTALGRQSADGLFHTIVAGAPGGPDTLVSIERLLGGSGGDTLAMTGIMGRATLDGGAGNDALSGQGSGLAHLVGGSGNDTLGGTLGRNLADYSGQGTNEAINVTSTGGADGLSGNDSFAGIDAVIGSAGNDTMNFGAATLSATLDGGAGDDLLTGGSSADLLTGGAGSDALAGGLGSDTASYAGNASNQAVSLTPTGGSDGLGSADSFSGIEAVIGGAGNDTIDFGAATFSASLSGAAGDDLLTSGTANDLLTGGAGNDTLVGGNGSEIAGYGGNASNQGVHLTPTGGSDGLGGTDSFSGIERVAGGAGADTIDFTAVAFTTTLEGGAGHDWLTGGSGADKLDGEDGNDRLVGGAGDDTLNGGWGNGFGDRGTDVADYSANTGAQAVSLTATGGADGLGGTDSFSGIEWVIGGAGDDTINFGATTIFSMTLEGGAGADSLITGTGGGVFLGGTGNDTLSGGSWIDVADYRANTGSQMLDLTATGGADGLGGTDSFISIERVIGGAGADTIDFGAVTAAVTLEGAAGHDRLTGGTANDMLLGGTDDDTLFGGEGADTLLGDAGDDSLSGGAGSDEFVGGAGANTIDGGDGIDRVTYAASTTAVRVVLGDATTGGDIEGDRLFSIEQLRGSVFDDTISYGGLSANVTVAGGEGADSLVGSLGADSLAGDAGADTILGGGGLDTLWGGDGDDLLVGRSGGDNLVGGSGADTVSYADATTGAAATLDSAGNVGAASGDTLTGIEALLGSAHADTLAGRAGDDSLAGGDGNDLLLGGNGNDVLAGGLGADRVVGGEGNDRIAGGNGADTLLGDEGDDTIASGNTNALVQGGVGNDALAVSGGNNTVLGGDGDDVVTVFGTPGAGDTIDGGAGNDILRYEQPGIYRITAMGEGFQVEYFGADTTGGPLATSSFTGFEGFAFDGGLFDPAELTDGAIFVCFAAGTRILTDRGEVPVELLLPGDRVATRSRRDAPMQPVLWVGRRRIVLAGRADAAEMAPVRIRAGALGESLPRRDLVVSPDHCLFLDGVLVPARLLVNGTTIVAETRVAEVTWFHIELERHDLVVAEGALAESWLDCGNRAWFENAPVAMLAVAGNLGDAGAGWDASRACAPLVHGGPRLGAIRAAIAARCPSASITGLGNPEHGASTTLMGRRPHRSR